VLLQLRKRNIGKVILAGMAAILCVESHLRELLERGFEVAVVKDATAAARHPELGDGYKAALINFGLSPTQFFQPTKSSRPWSKGTSVIFESKSLTANALPPNACQAARSTRPSTRAFLHRFSAQRSTRDSARAAKRSLPTSCCRRCGSSSVGTTRSQPASGNSMEQEAPGSTRGSAPGPDPDRP